jgi:uncharacterized protein YuzE
MIKISYDKEGDVLEIKFSEEAVADSEYVEENGLVVDYDRDGKMISVEVVSFTKRVRDKKDIEVLAG